jgi:transcription antitermination factor NusG
MPTHPDEERLVGAPEVLTGLVIVEGGRWYVAHTRSRNEKILADELGRLRIPHYLPLAQRITRSAATRRLSRSLIPVFPGYVFFHGTDEQRYTALRTNRIAQVLEVTDQAQLIRELDHLRLLLTTQQDFFVAPRLQKGDWGRITSGSLMSLEGIITNISGKYRLTMNVTILGQSVSVELDRHLVEKIDPPQFVSN